MSSPQLHSFTSLARTTLEKVKPPQRRALLAEMECVLARVAGELNVVCDPPALPGRTGKEPDVPRLQPTAT